tara:strand:+ start:168 stop:797 length:630 start_codon:yes stop_codon:yes gene_type:complete
MGIVERREREKLERRNSILESAEELFFQNGYEKTRMLEIADRCELSKGALYLYFNNKEELAKAVVVRAHDILLELLQENASRAETGVEKIEAMLQALLTVYRDHYRYFYLAFVLESHLQDYLIGDRKWPERVDRIDRIHSLAAEVIRQGQRDGTIRAEVEPELAAMTAMTAAEGFMHRLFLFGSDVCNNRYATDALIESFIKILVSSVA